MYVFFVPVMAIRIIILVCDCCKRGISCGCLLHAGIDTDQFESDSEYRHNIVLMLARYVTCWLLVVCTVEPGHPCGEQNVGLY